MAGVDSGPPPIISCFVDVERSGKALTLRGRIISSQFATGGYRFEIVKESGSGTAHIGQSGIFSVEDGKPSLAGSTTIDFAPGTHVAASLNASALGREFTCKRDEVADD